MLLLVIMLYIICISFLKLYVIGEKWEEGLGRYHRWYLRALFVCRRYLLECKMFFF
jgi:hypothetical protein